MTAGDIPHGASERPSKRRRRLQLAGTPRNQEARRKEIVVYLDRLRRECERRIRKANRLHDFFKSDLEIIKARPLYDARGALADAFHLDLEGNGQLSSTIAKMVGIESSPRDGETLHHWRQRVISVIFEWDDDPPVNVSGDPTKQDSPPTPPESKSAPPAPSADMALAEALRIAREAEDATVEIDWTDNPASDREAELRLAIIRRIETEEMELFDVPHYVLLALRNLTPGAEVIGEDLYDAIERWQVRCDDHAREHNAKERRRLLDAARRDLDGGNRAD